MTSEPNKKFKPLLSVIITAHSEGLLAHKTMLSIYAALEKLATSTPYEVLISIDSGSEETKKYFASYRSRENHTVLEVNYKDLSASRNNAVKSANGTYVAFLDADDLVSSNWFLVALGMVLKDKDVIIHPEYSVTFDDYDLIWRKRDSGNIVTDTLCLVDNNLWDSPCLARKDVFTTFPYYAIGRGIGYEDKHFNSQTIAHGYPHKVAPETILFVRRKTDGSLLTQSASSRVTVAQTDLLSYESMHMLDISEYEYINNRLAEQTIGNKVTTRAIKSSKSLLLKTHSKAVRYPLYARTIKGLRAKRQSRINETIRSQFPNEVLTEWRDIHKIENLIFPNKELLKHIPWYNAENPIVGVSYARTLQELNQKPDTLFFVPHLVKGGADKVFINYLSYLNELQPSWRIAMLQTEATKSVWADKVPVEVDFINFHDLSSHLDRDAQMRILATTVTQLGITRIIIGNSQLAYDFCAAYKTLLTTLGVAIYCFAFGEEFDDEGRLWGLVHTGIPKIYPQIYRIITDNNNIVKKLEREYGFDPAKFTVHYQPTDLTLSATNLTTNHPLKIMWASRVCKQKRPDILKAVSNMLDPTKYSIDAYGQLEEGLTPAYFDDSRVNYKGSFNGASTLPIDQYDVFLYTSEGDGVPNMLQEITALGLPIVASNVGGIKEFIEDKKTGRLMIDHEAIRDYVSAIESLSDPELRKKYNRNAQELLKTGFSRETLLRKVARDFNK